MDSPQDTGWQDYAALYNWGLGDIVAMAGQHSCFCLEVSDHMINMGTHCLVKAHISGSAQMRCAGRNQEWTETTTATVPQKVLIKATLKDYDLVLRHCQRVRLIQAFIQVEEGQVILDAVSSPSFFSGRKEIQADEVVQVAEIFAGGFAGWSRATAALRRMGTRVNTQWCLERDTACVAPLSHVENNLKICYGPEDCDTPGTPFETSVFVTDFNTTWWRLIAAQTQPQVYCVSAPCQPWSRAGTEAGMASPDGAILLQVVDYLKAVTAPIAIFEEVDHFPKHRHFQQFCNAMQQADFECVWRASLQLAEISPSFRSRFFMVWVHNDFRHLAGRFHDSRWIAKGFPSLQEANVIFDSLPPALLEPCMLAPDVLSMYLDPALLPPSRTGSRHLKPEEVRIVKPTQQAGTFMAQYHFQHQLPTKHLRSKGILGCLLQSPQGVRFVAAPEIASVHGAHTAVFLSTCDRDSMRILGNALAVQQATFVLSLACLMLPSPSPIPNDAVCTAESMRLHAGNSVLLEIRDGWLMCHPDHAGSLVASQSLWTQVKFGLSRAPDVFWDIDLALGEGASAVRFRCRASKHFSLEQVLQFFELSDAKVMRTAGASSILVDSSYSVTIPLLCSTTVKSPNHHCIHAIAQGVHFFLHRHKPDILSQLHQVFQSLPTGCGEVACFDTVGKRVFSVLDMPEVVLVTTVHGQVTPNAPVWSIDALQAGRILPGCSALTLAVPAEFATDWWFFCPRHLVQALGFEVRFSQFPPPADTAFIISFCATQSAGPVSTELFCRWLRQVLFLAPVRDAAREARRNFGLGLQTVEVQVGSHSLWTGCLPDSVLPCFLGDCWKGASQVLGLDPAARIFSGPFPIQEAVPLSKQPVGAGSGLFIRKRTGTALLTVMPAVYGGGAKDEKAQMVQAKAAKLCLDHGFDSEAAHKSAKLLLQQLGLSKLGALLDSPSPDLQWEKLQAAMQEKGIAAPPSQQVAARVARRVGSQARKKLQFGPKLRADDFRIAGGFFVNSDNSPTCILHSLMPRTSGVILLDFEVAKAAIADMSPAGPEEFAILTLGHSCPHKESCSAQVHFPAHTMGEDGHVLLVGCLHNLGEKHVRTSTKQVAQVAVESMVPCTFMAHADEWTEGSAWSSITSSPVRALTDLVKQEGMPHPVRQPSARVFKWQGKTTTPAHCDFVQFQALVPEAVLPDVLRNSGHKGAYVVPRDNEGQIRAGWEVIWISASKQETMRASLAVRQQAGIVRAKSRFGIRVPAACFDEVFKSLKPGFEPRPRINVQHLYRLSPIPPWGG